MRTCQTCGGVTKKKKCPTLGCDDNELAVSTWRTNMEARIVNNEFPKSGNVVCCTSSVLARFHTLRALIRRIATEARAHWDASHRAEFEDESILAVWCNLRCCGAVLFLEKRITGGRSSLYLSYHLRVVGVPSWRSSGQSRVRVCHHHYEYGEHSL
jgi:hypothetical protein